MVNKQQAKAPIYIMLSWVSPCLAGPTHTN